MKIRSNWRTWLAFAHDVCAAALAWVAMYWLRFNLDLRAPYAPDMWITLAWILPLQAMIFLTLGLYRGLWRFASIIDLQRIVLAAGLGAIVIPLVLVMLQLQTIVPRSVVFLYPIVLIFLMAGSRFAYRVWKEHRLYSPFAALGEPVLITGAGEAGARLTEELARSRQWRVVGLLDDDPAKQGRQIRNVSVLGPISDLAHWTRRYGVRKVIIALPSMNHVVRRRVVELCAAAQVEALTVPPYEDLISGRLALTTLRNVELDDLLGRDPVVLDNEGLAEWLGNRVVMVTGAGGSIGAELARQIARFRPAKLVLFDLSEAAVYEIQTALADAFPQLPLTPVVGDVKHTALVEEVLARERPDVVFHAAAYKHVPLMEETNAWQAIRNNAYGTWVVARAAVDAKVEKFVLVSTDKAVNPTSVMGEPVRIVDLARDMIRLYGADPDQVAVVFTGLRPGEKLYEEPLASEEATKPTRHPKLRIAQARDANRDAVGQMVAWCERDRAADDAEVRGRLKTWIAEYSPPAGAPIKPFPAEPGREETIPLPLRAPRRRS